MSNETKLEYDILDQAVTCQLRRIALPLEAASVHPGPSVLMRRIPHDRDHYLLGIRWHPGKLAIRVEGMLVCEEVLEERQIRLTLSGPGGEGMQSGVAE